MTNQLKRMTVDIANETVRRMVPLGATTYSAELERVLRNEGPFGVSEQAVRLVFVVYLSGRCVQRI